ncbi:MAG: hypothetical protein HQP61_09385 [Peptococcaceae bacterium]|nr:hypothetical protein [Candidatus Syntrophopropionicum ammoniitolerans]
MRVNFWRGIVAGSIIGAALSMMTGRRDNRSRISRMMKGRSVREVRRSADRVLRGMTKSVNNLIK